MESSNHSYQIGILQIKKERVREGSYPSKLVTKLGAETGFGSRAKFSAGRALVLKTRAGGWLILNQCDFPRP